MFKKCKFGIIKYPNVDKWEKKNNMKERYGIYYYNDGDRYEGEWRNNFRINYGILYYNNGDRYEENEKIILVMVMECCRMKMEYFKWLNLTPLEMKYSQNWTDGLHVNLYFLTLISYFIIIFFSQKFLKKLVAYSILSRRI